MFCFNEIWGLNLKSGRVVSMSSCSLESWTEKSTQTAEAQKHIEPRVMFPSFEKREQFKDTSVGYIAKCNDQFGNSFTYSKNASRVFSFFISLF